MSLSSLSIIVPAYNEAKRLPRTLELLEKYCNQLKFPVEIIVIDDGSTDHMFEQVQSGSFTHTTVIRLERNVGKFGAFRKGVGAAKYDWVLLYDADGATPISMLNKFLPLTTEYDCLIGSRRTLNAAITVPQPIFRTVLGRLSYGMIRMCTGIQFKDTQCGFKLCRADLAKQAAQQMVINRFAGDVEFIYLVILYGGRATEVPVEWHDVPDSKVRLKDYYRSLRDVFTIRRNIRRGLYQSVSGKP